MPTSRRRRRRLTPADSSLAPEAMVQRCSHDYWGYLMKRILFLVIITVVAVGLLAAPALAGTTVCKVGLYAGQNTHVGYLLITHDTSAPSLTITYDLKAGYKLKEVHLAVAHDAAGIPVNPAGAAAPGKFPLARYPWTNNTTFTIDCHEAGPAPLVIAAHAVVVNPCTCFNETAWATRACSCCGDATVDVFDFARGWAKWIQITPN